MTGAAFLASFWGRLPVCATGQCWEWMGPRHQRGYGLVRFRLQGGQWTTMTAPRLAWILIYGEDVPAHLYACHHCDNPPCCNPSHLYLGTPLENTQDWRLRSRMDPQDRQAIECAAQIMSLKPGGFMVEAALDRARAILRRSA